MDMPWSEENARVMKQEIARIQRGHGEQTNLPITDTDLWIFWLQLADPLVQAMLDDGIPREDIFAKVIPILMNFDPPVEVIPPSSDGERRVLVLSVMFGEDIKEEVRRTARERGLGEVNLNQVRDPFYFWHGFFRCKQDVFMDFVGESDGRRGVTPSLIAYTGSMKTYDSRGTGMFRRLAPGGVKRLVEIAKKWGTDLVKIEVSY